MLLSMEQMINDVKYIESDILTFHNNMDVFKIHTNQLFKYKNQLYNCIKYKMMFLHSFIPDRNWI